MRSSIYDKRKTAWEKPVHTVQFFTEPEVSIMYMLDSLP